MDRHMQALVSGIEAGRVASRNGREAYWEELARGQSPGIAVICCSDSRAAPEEITRADPGSMFVKRTVAGLVPTPAGKVEGAWLRLYGGLTRHLGMRELAGAWYGPWAAIEFPVVHLKVPNLLVLGHSGCGGVALARRPRGEAGHLVDTDAWVDMVRPTVQAAARKAEREGRDVQLATEHAAILWSLRNLLLHPRVAARVRLGELRLYAGHYDIASGRVALWNPETDAFEPISERAPGICDKSEADACSCGEHVKRALAALSA
ncbi:carbonic anhydrase [Desertibaculum subflavum]|uniref:carbonic anhydrase n=1 Tax=Desertibaculum subflavum TaxID=2268458 RepID=UPI000E66C708